MKYDEITHELVEQAIEKFRERVTTAFEKHGSQCFASAHEGYGVIAEEVAELLDAIRANDPEEIKKESMDVAVSAMWLWASEESGQVLQR